MADERIETLLYCIGPVGGIEDNPVCVQRPDYTSHLDFTTEGYTRYINDASNVVKFQQIVLNFFLDSIKTAFPDNPLGFVNNIREEVLKSSARQLKKQLEHMYEEYKENIRKSLEDQEKMHRESLKESSSSPAKLPKLDSEAATGAEPGAALQDKMPIGKLKFPENIFMKKIQEFRKVLVQGYTDLKVVTAQVLKKAKDKIMGRKPANLMEFTLKNIDELAKMKYYSLALNHLIVDLDGDLKQLELDIFKPQSNERRLTEWLYCHNYGDKNDKHYMLLVTMELAYSIEEVSALAEKQIKKFVQIKKDLKKDLSTEHAEAFEEKVQQWRESIVGPSTSKESLGPQLSNASDDTLKDVEELEEDK